MKNYISIEEPYLNNRSAIHDSDMPERIIDTLTGDEPADKNTNIEDLKKVIHYALDGLKAREKYVIEQYYLCGMPTRDIASKMGMSIGAVDSIRTKALVRIRVRYIRLLMPYARYPFNCYNKEIEERKQRILKGGVDIGAAIDRQRKATEKNIKSGTFRFQTSDNLFELVKSGAKKELYILKQDSDQLFRNVKGLSTEKYIHYLFHELHLMTWRNAYSYEKNARPDRIKCKSPLVKRYKFVELHSDSGESMILNWTGLEFGIPNVEWCEGWYGQKLFVITFK